MIELFFEDIDELQLENNIVSHQLEQMILLENKKPGNISVIFCSDDYLLDINIKYLNHNFYTDIVTFDYVEENLISGDLFISVDRVKENAKKFDQPFKKELFRVILHGVLHLIGYNDKTEEEQKMMRSKEDFYLKKVDFNTIEL